MFQYYQNPMQQIIRVNGEEGAKAYQMYANSSAILLDESAARIFVKVTDGAGYPTITAYDIKPHVVEKIPDLNSISERLSRLEEIINEQSNTSNVKRTKSNGSDNGNKVDASRKRTGSCDEYADAD